MILYCKLTCKSQREDEESSLIVSMVLSASPTPLSEQLGGAGVRDCSTVEGRGTMGGRVQSSISSGAACSHRYDAVEVVDAVFAHRLGRGI